MFIRLSRDRSVRSAAPWQAIAAALLLGACASTEIATESVQGAAAAQSKPDRLVVYDFAVSPEEVKLEHGPIADLRELASKEPRTEQEKAVGRSVANALSEKLVAELRAKGLTAVRETQAVAAAARPMLVKGQLLSIDQGNAASRAVIGFGAGRSSVEARVQLYASVDGRTELTETMRADARSSRMPGMGPMVGVGSLAGRLLTSTVLSGAAAGAREKLAGDVDALAEAMAKTIAVKIEDYYRARGWL